MSPTSAPLAADHTDHDTISALVQTHQRGLWRYLRSLGADPALADEIAVDALATAFERRMHDGEATTGRFLRATARHLYLRRRRDAGRRLRLLAEAADRLWERDCASDGGEAYLTALRACVEALPLRARRAVTACYRDGADRGALAAELDLQPNGLKTLLQRTRARLRACIQHRLSEPT